MTATRVEPAQRFTRDHPCPICEGHKDLPPGKGKRCYGFLSADQEYAHCTREELAGAMHPDSDGMTYAHRLHGACRCGRTHGEPHGPTFQYTSNGTGKGTSTLGREVARYSYTDEARTELYHVRRYEPKDFRPYLPGADWPGLKDTPKVPYRLPELMEADPGELVFVVEGEKDADALRASHLTATTSQGGAGQCRQWLDPAFAAPLARQHVVILPDNDRDGERFAATVAQGLAGVAASIRILRLPGLPPKGDVSDWLAAGGTIDELILLADAIAPEAPGKPDTSELDAEPGEEAPPRNTDVGNGQRLVRRHGRDLRYCDRLNGWLIWDGRRFARDETGEIERRAKDIPRGLYAEAATLADAAARKELVSWALRSESGPRLREMIAAARSEDGIAVTPATFDADPWLFNVANGTLDLQTGQLRPADRADHITKLAPVVYDPAATCPTWLAFLNRVLNGHDDVIDFLQRAVGYSLTGDISEHCLFILYGTGRNGKSTFAETIGALLGDYAMTTSTDTLLVRRDGGIPNDVARLVGARLVAASESEAGRSLAEALVKQLTGGDTISARFLHAEFFDFKPAFKLWFRTNHKPTIKGSDDGIWSRIRLVPFTQRIADSEQDRRLPARLLAELPGILNWALAGCIAWQRNGLGMPTAVAKATAEYRAEMDVLATFLADCCNTGGEHRCTAKALYTAYTAWAEASGERVMSQKALALRLMEKGFVSARGHGGARMWSGLAVKTGDG